MKKTISIILALSGLLVLLPGAKAQNMSDMCINEVLVINTDDYMDNFGHRSGWLELFNTSYGTVDIGGCYLTNDPGNLTKYMIPRGDVLTKVKPRQHILFWADSIPARGTFHLNFKLENSDEVYLVSSDGTTIIDKISIPKNDIEANVSYGRFKDGITVHKEDGNIDKGQTWGILDKTTPSSANFGAGIEQPGMKLKEMDPYGVIMALTSMSIVFLSLIFLYLVFKHIGKYNVNKSKARALAASAGMNKKTLTDTDEVPGEVYAAIAAALHSYFRDDETHDLENTVLTIDKVKRNYSPWSSKIYTLRETPQKK
jgi:Na+-transporting methylmalonyl-CoA/oxaloacetate decarboxylase gamma subunit